MTSPDSSEKKITPTQASFDVVEKESLIDRLSAIRESIRQVLRAINPGVEESEQLSQTRTALLKILADNEAEDNEHIRMVLKERLELDRKREEVKSSPPGTRAHGEAIKAEVVPVTRENSNLRRTISVSRSLSGTGRPRSRTVSRPPDINTQLFYLSKDEDQLLTARPPVASANSSRSRRSSQVSLQPVFPVQQGSILSTRPVTEDADGQIMMKPYMTVRKLTQDFNKLPWKLQDLLNANEDTYWPFIQEWYRNLLDEDLDKETKELCEKNPLSREVTLAEWNDFVQLGRDVRAD